ncbi:MAG TPA: histidine triad nucleotide-binding protein [Candidatus Acidoferrales bacterium]|nr:histidine triad nucleotide-binding protein [Candidatus Acidoferrales bacterium]
MTDCIFCKIGRKEIPARIVYEDPELFAFEDIHPQAPMHLLVCPRRHVSSLSDASAADAELVGRIVLAGAKLASDRGYGAGHRTIFNTGEEAGQTVFHLHLHVLGGRPMHWPAG